MIEVVAHSDLEDGEHFGSEPALQSVCGKGAQDDREKGGDGSRDEEKAFHYFSRFIVLV